MTGRGRVYRDYKNYSVLPTNKWVGNKLGLSDGTICSYLHKIKRKLEKYLINKNKNSDYIQN